MNGADAVVRSLEEEGVKYVFGYPGVAICPFYNSILESDIKTIPIEEFLSPIRIETNRKKNAKIEKLIEKYELTITNAEIQETDWYDGTNVLLMEHFEELVKDIRKIGISNNKMIDTKDYVLGHFTKEEEKIINESIEKGVSIIEDFFRMNFDRLMGKYN